MSRASPIARAGRSSPPLRAAASARSTRSRARAGIWFPSTTISIRGWAPVRDRLPQPEPGAGVRLAPDAPDHQEEGELATLARHDPPVSRRWAERQGELHRGVPAGASVGSGPDRLAGNPDGGDGRARQRRRDLLAISGLRDLRG